MRDLSKAFSVSEKPISEKEEVHMPTSTVYEKLADLYLEIYGFHGKKRLNKKIEAYVKKGLTREEAVQKVAKEGGYK